MNKPNDKLWDYLPAIRLLPQEAHDGTPGEIVPILSFKPVIILKTYIMGELSFLYFKGKMARLPYLLWNLGIFLFLLMAAERTIVVAAILAVYASIALHVARLRDLKFKKVYMVIIFLGIFVPFINIISFGILFLVPGYTIRTKSDGGFCCPNCGNPSLETDFKCQKCGEQFWVSKKKYDEFLRNGKRK